MFSPLGIEHGDAFLVYFILKHWMQVLLGAGQLIGTLPMFHGYDGSLFFTDHHAFYAVVAVPFFLLSKNIVFSAHAVVISMVMFSFVSMYMFIWYMTKNAMAALISGILFVLNPFVFARYPDQLNLINLGWIPLVFLFFEKSIHKSGKDVSMLYFFLCLAGQVASSLYYSVFLSIFLPIYIGIRWLQERFSWRTWVNIPSFVGFAVFSAVLGITIHLYQGVYAKYPLSRTGVVAQTYAARSTDWLFTSENNVLFGNLKKWATMQFPDYVRSGIYSEHNLFPGLVFIIFLLCGVFMRRLLVHKNQFSILLWFLLIFAWILSLGPSHWFGSTAEFNPLYRVLYALHPYLQSIRTTSRFAVFVYFFGAWIAAYVWVHVSKRMSKEHMRFFFVTVASVLLLEYWNKPLSYVEITSQKQEVYAQISKDADIQVILEYPIGNLISYPYPQARSEDLDAHYLLWASILHEKKLYNGYSGFLPESYYKTANALSVNFPTDDKLLQLKKAGVDVVVVHRDEFLDTSVYETFCAAMRARGVPVFLSLADEMVFDLRKWK